MDSEGSAQIPRPTKHLISLSCWVEEWLGDGPRLYIERFDCSNPCIACGISSQALAARVVANPEIIGVADRKLVEAAEVFGKFRFPKQPDFRMFSETARSTRHFYRWVGAVLPPSLARLLRPPRAPEPGSRCDNPSTFLAATSRSINVWPGGRGLYPRKCRTAGMY